LDNRDVGTPDTVVIHVDKNILKRWVNVDCVVGELYLLVKKVKVKFTQSKTVLSGAMWRADVSWRRIGALNDRYDWIAKTMGVTFMDRNSWLVDSDFARDGLHINRRGARPLSQV